MESRFLEPSVSRTCRYLEPNLISLGFASLKLYNFTSDFSNPRFLETPDNSNQLWLPWDKLTLDNSNLRKFPNHLVRMSITFTSLNKFARLDKLFFRIRKPQICHQSERYNDCFGLQNKGSLIPIFLKLLLQYINKFCSPLEMKSVWHLHAFAIAKVNHRPEFLGCKEATSYFKFQLNELSAIYRLHDMCSVLFRNFCFLSTFRCK